MNETPNENKSGIRNRGGKRVGSNQRRVTIWHQFWYQVCRTSIWLFMTPMFRVWHHGRRNIPWTGPVLVVSNHQSYLDPPAIGIGVWRRMNYLAKQELFVSKLFGRLIRSVDAIPLDQHGIGFAGIKETLKRLRNGEMVLIFPEGSRSPDGNLMPFKTGYINIAVKSGATIIPTAIDGAQRAFPPQARWPSFFKPPIRIEYGKPITPSDYAGLSEDELHRLVESRVVELFEKIHSKAC